MSRNLPLRLVGLSGNFARPSRTRSLVEAAVTGAGTLWAVETEVLDLLDFQPSLGGAIRASDLSGGAAAAFERLITADALVIGSPTYKGTYTGLLKHLVDLIDPDALRGKPVLLVATGGGDRHALLIEHSLRPLLGFFEAQTLATGVYATDRDFTDGQPASAALLERLGRAVGQFAPFLPPREVAGRPALAAPILSALA
jgi:FMN reductase